MHPDERDVTVVMPVYNEQECIARVIASWTRALEAEGVRFRIIVMNDGSTDATLAVLRRVTDLRVEIVDKPNSGHGPTILDGYRRAVMSSTWVFQADSDDEIGADAFGSLWRSRAGRLAVFGVRVGRNESPTRWLLTRVSRLVVYVLFGGRVKDVNVPFRLMRSDVLAAMLSQIPATTFAPNLLIAGAFSRSALSIANVGVPARPRQTGRASLVRLTLWRAAARAAAETIRHRRVMARTAPVVADGGAHTVAAR